MGGDRVPVARGRSKFGSFFLGLFYFASSCVFVSHAKQHATNRPRFPGWEKSGEVNSPLRTDKKERAHRSFGYAHLRRQARDKRKDAGLPDQNRRDPHKPGESPPLQQQKKKARARFAKCAKRPLQRLPKKLLDLKLTLSFSIFLWHAANSFWRRL